jgi:hypothetical protein
MCGRAPMTCPSTRSTTCSGTPDRGHEP